MVTDELPATANLGVDVNFGVDWNLAAAADWLGVGCAWEAGTCVARFGRRNLRGVGVYPRPLLVTDFLRLTPCAELCLKKKRKCRLTDGGGFMAEGA